MITIIKAITLASRLAFSIEAARLFERRFSDFLDEIWSMYDEQDALGQGVSTGWTGLDPFYRVRSPLPFDVSWQYA
jgi:hypothetical protein